MNLRRGKTSGILGSEKGIALVFVLILSLICLAIVATLIFLVTQGTRFSGFNKRYETAREASYGGIEVIRALIRRQGDLSSEMKIFFGSQLQSKSTTSFAECDCGDTTNPDSITPNPDTCLCRKLCSPTLKTDGSYNWKTCDNNIDPIYASDGTTYAYDLKFQLRGFSTDPLSPKWYDVFGKIVDTSLGNSDLSGLNLGGTAVVASSGSTIAPPPDPYLYTIEITGQDTDYATNLGLRERGRLSVLYAY